MAVIPKNEPRDKMQFICIECGKPFIKSKRQEQMCSEECRTTRKKRRKQAYMKKWRAVQKELGMTRIEPSKFGAKTRHFDATFGVTPEEREAMGLRPLNPGMRPCANCDRMFYSWDKTRKVLCPLCTVEAEEHDKTDPHVIPF